MKKLSVGAWICCAAALLAILGFIAYTSNVSGEGYYQGAYVNNFSLAVWGAAVCLLLSVCLNAAAKGKVVDIVTGILLIAAPALLAFALMNLVAGRVDGLGYIFFSNADVAKEVQTPANMGSASTAIWNMGFVSAAMLVSIVAAFFSLRKKDA